MQPMSGAAMSPVISRPAQATANGSGIATATITNDSAGQTWTVQQMTVLNDSVAATTASIYKNNISTSTFILAAYLSGNNDSSVGDSITLHPGESVICQWVGADTGSHGTFRLEATVAAL